MEFNSVDLPWKPPPTIRVTPWGIPMPVTLKESWRNDDYLKLKMAWLFKLYIDGVTTLRISLPPSLTFCSRPILRTNETHTSIRAIQIQHARKNQFHWLVERERREIFSPITKHIDDAKRSSHFQMINDKRTVIRRTFEISFTSFDTTNICWFSINHRDEEI